MAIRSMEVTIISAKDLKDVHGLFGRMKTYAVVWIDSSEKHFTNINAVGGIHPKWNRRIYWSVDEKLLREGGGVLKVEIYNQGGRFDKRDTILGSVDIPLEDFGKNMQDFGVSDTQYSCYHIRRPSGEFKGILNVGFRLGGLFHNCKSFDIPDDHSLPSKYSPNEVIAPI